MKMRASEIDLQPFCRMKLALRQSSFPGDSSKNIQGQFERVQYTQVCSDSCTTQREGQKRHFPVGLLWEIFL